MPAPDELTLEEKVAVLWRWHERMNEFAKLEQLVSSLNQKYSDERWVLYHDLAKPEALKP